MRLAGLWCSLGWKSPPGRQPAQSLWLLDPIWDYSMTFNLGPAHTSGVISLHSFLKVEEERPKHIGHEHPSLWPQRRLWRPPVCGTCSSLYLLWGYSGWGLPRGMCFSHSQWDQNFYFLLAEVSGFMCGITQWMWGSSPSGHETGSESVEAKNSGASPSSPLNEVICWTVSFCFIMPRNTPSGWQQASTRTALQETQV